MLGKINKKLTNDYLGFVTFTSLTSRQTNAFFYQRDIRKKSYILQEK